MKPTDQQKSGNKASNKATGALGESLAAEYLETKGFRVLDRNYLKKWGEIDIVVAKALTVHFIEVKTVSYETKADLDKAVSYGTWRPEENVHAYKVKKLSRAIESWLQERKWGGDWQIDVIGVRIVPRETFASIKYIENIVF